MPGRDKTGPGGQGPMTGGGRGGCGNRVNNTEANEEITPNPDNAAPGRRLGMGRGRGVGVGGGGGRGMARGQGSGWPRGGGRGRMGR